jgi:anti-sigma factor RsiW
MQEPHDSPMPLLARLLGPADRELTCEQCFDLIDVYADAELSGQDADAKVPGMRAHLEGCPACAEEHETLRDLIGARHD